MTTVAESSVTTVCDNAAPTREEPISMTMLVAHRMMPCILDVFFKVVAPAICQKMFSAFAPPTMVTIAPEPTVRSPEIYRIHTAPASDLPEALVPLNVRDEVNPTLVPHLYNLGGRMWFSMSPAPCSILSGVGLPAASVYAVSMSLMAVVILDGMGLV